MFLLRVENEIERQFYEVESYINQWKLKELERQYNSGLFERLALSRDKDSVLKLARKGQSVNRPEDVLKDPPQE